MIVCALANSSCLVPQSVDPIVETPHPPPHFVLELINDNLLAPILPLYRQGSADAASVPPCHCRIDLSMGAVEEDDPTVALEVRWFIDYDASVFISTLPRWTDHLTPDDFNNTTTVRPYGTVRSIDADALGLGNGIHRVDVVVGESAGFDPDPNSTRPNRKMKTGYAAAEHTFIINVNVDPDPARPRCPATLPSVRVCQ